MTRVSHAPILPFRCCAINAAAGAAVTGAHATPAQEQQEMPGLAESTAAAAPYDPTDGGIAPAAAAAAAAEEQDPAAHQQGESVCEMLLM
jgi:hypothetical protein